MAPDAVTCITKRVHEQVHARITTAVARLRRRSALLLLPRARSPALQARGLRHRHEQVQYQLKRG